MNTDPNQSQELLPCPFCGQSKASENTTETVVKCLHCGAHGPILIREGDHVHEWNTRARAEQAGSEAWKPSNEVSRISGWNWDFKWLEEIKSKLTSLDSQCSLECIDDILSILAQDYSRQPAQPERVSETGTVVSADFARKLSDNMQTANELIRQLQAELTAANAKLAEWKTGVAEWRAVSQDAWNRMHHWEGKYAIVCRENNAMRKRSATLRAELENARKEREELREIRGCVDYGAISAGRATALSEVQRTITALRESQHAADQLRIRAETAEDKLTEARQACAAKDETIKMVLAHIQEKPPKTGTAEETDYIIRELAAEEACDRALSLDSGASIREQVTKLQQQAAYDNEAIERMQQVGAENEVKIANLTRERDGLREDKERLDWLERRGFCFRMADRLYEQTGDNQWKLWVIGEGTEWSYNESRKVIDAAMEVDPDIIQAARQSAAPAQEGGES